MSLRVRVVALIGAVLLVSMVLGTLVAGYQVRRALSAELGAGLTGAEQTVQSAFEDLPHSDHPARDLHQLVATFDGNRHVQATLIDAEGGPIQTSRTDAPASKALGWFRRLLGSAPKRVEIGVPKRVRGFSRIVLTPTPAIDVANAWAEFCGVIVVLAGSAAIGLALVYVVIGAAFRPLRGLAAEFDRIGAGDYGGRVEEAGPSELISLQRGFNTMAGQLAGTTARNRLLTDQLLTIQDEERADIARDLHDEIGPHLFGVNMDAEMIAKLNDAGAYDAIPGQVRSIQTAVGHMQRQVRDLLGRLRPARATEFGLNAAIKDLALFWAARRADIAFELDLLDHEARLPEAMKDAVYRVVQEAANNAVRHGDPASIQVRLDVQNQNDLVVMVCDDGAKTGTNTNADGLGLIGMRERVTALGGTLVFGPSAEGKGWTVAARLPIHRMAAVRQSMESVS